MALQWLELLVLDVPSKSLGTRPMPGTNQLLRGPHSGSSKVGVHVSTNCPLAFSCMVLAPQREVLRRGFSRSEYLGCATTRLLQNKSSDDNGCPDSVSVCPARF